MATKAWSRGGWEAVKDRSWCMSWQKWGWKMTVRKERDDTATQILPRFRTRGRRTGQAECETQTGTQTKPQMFGSLSYIAIDPIAPITPLPPSHLFHPTGTLSVLTYHPRPKLKPNIGLGDALSNSDGFLWRKSSLDIRFRSTWSTLCLRLTEEGSTAVACVYPQPLSFHSICWVSGIVVRSFS